MISCPTTKWLIIHILSIQKILLKIYLSGAIRFRATSVYKMKLIRNITIILLQAKGKSPIVLIETYINTRKINFISYHFFFLLFTTWFMKMLIQAFCLPVNLDTRLGILSNSDFITNSLYEKQASYLLTAENMSSLLNKRMDTTTDHNVRVICNITIVWK